MKYCRYCGKPIDDDSTFCTYCGKQQVVVSPKDKSTFVYGKTAKNLVKEPFMKVSSFISCLYRVIFNKRTLLVLSIIGAIAFGITLLVCYIIGDDMVDDIPGKGWGVLLPLVICFALVYMCKLVKSRNIKMLMIILTCFAFAFFVIEGYIIGKNYYDEVYLPQKRLDDACTDIKKKLVSENDSISLLYSYYVLWNDHEWGYNQVNDSIITQKLAEDRKEAFARIEKAAYSGIAKFQFALGQLYWYSNNYVEQDHVKAVYWWNESSKQNYIHSFNNLGLSYMEGDGVTKDLKQGIEYLKKGAEGGDNYAQWNYGNLYRDGIKIKVGSHKEQRVTSQYMSERIREYRDDASCQNMYVYLEEVDDSATLIEKNIEKAKYWWEKAAAQGNKGAKDALQKVY